MIIERLFLINGKDSRWEDFFLALESKDAGDWVILKQDKNDRSLWRVIDNSRVEDYQQLKYRTFESGYHVFLKKRLVIYKRDDLFKSYNNVQDKDVALIRTLYILKRVKGDYVERFGGKRIKELYEGVVPWNGSRLN